MRKGEFEVLGNELLNVRALDISGLFKLNYLEDVNRPETRTVSGGHILVKSNNGVGTGHFTILLVHVVGSRARVVTDPDTEVLDLERTLLMDLIEADDLSVGLLHFTELHQEVPETGLGDNGVRSEYSHAVELGCWIRVSGQVAANDLVFRKTCCDATLLAIVHS